MAVRILQLVGVLLFALVAGVFWGTWLSLARSMSDVTPETFLEVGHLMIANLARPMSLLLPASILVGLAIVFVRYRRRDSSAFVLAALAVLLMSAAMATTLLVNVPLDAEFTSWTIDTLPSDWRGMRDRWELYHGLRTLLSVAALASLIGSVLWGREARGAR